MNRKNIEDKLSMDLDAYLAGIENKDELASQEYMELLALGKHFIDKDFSKSSNKEAVFHKTLKSMRSYRGKSPVKVVSRLKRSITVAASLALICVLSISLVQPSFAHNVLEKIIRTITLGHITVIQTEPRKDTSAVPDELKGKFFDETGEPIEVFSQTYTGKIYTAKGEEVIAFANGEAVTASDQENILVVRESHDLSKYTCFEVILPSYLPEGYRFDRAEFYKNEDGTVTNSKYINLYFTNSKEGKYIYIQQRYADEDTAYAVATDGNVEQIKINGVTAILSDNRAIDWEKDKVLYMLTGRGELTRNELIKIAESVN